MLMTKIIYAKYPGKCKVCGNKTERNEEVVWAPREGVKHLKCDFTLTPPSSDDAEFMKGVNDVRQYHEERDLLGREMAEMLAMQREYDEY